MDICPRDEHKTLEWITVLCSAKLPYRLSYDDGKWMIHVPASSAEVAHREIDTYEEENRDWPPRDVDFLGLPVTRGTKWAAGLAAATVLLFFAWLGPYRPYHDVLRAASMDSAAVVSGEFWRLLTCLTVHADLTHVLSNTVCLFFFTLAVCQCMGTGLGLFLILVSAAAANAAVAFGSGMRHVAVGASSACFAAVGILSSNHFIRRLRGCAGDRVARGRAWISLFAGLGLLGVLGTGPRSDLSAHAFGFVFGMLLCLPFSWFGVDRFSRWGQCILGVLAVAALAGAWCLVAFVV